MSWFLRLFRKKQYQKGWQCPKCFLKREHNHGPDPCLGYLPSVKYACCGHGNDKFGGAYIMFSNNKIIRMYGEISVEEKIRR